MYFLLHKTSIKLLFCKATNIIAEIQRVGNPKRPSKLQNSSWVLGSAVKNYINGSDKENRTPCKLERQTL